MDVDVGQNQSQTELLRSPLGNGRMPPDDDPKEKTLKNVSKREWIIVFILCYVNLINYMDRFTIAGILTDIQKSLNVQNELGGLLQTVFVITYMIFAPIFGYLGDRYSRRLIMAFGVFLWSFTTLAGSFMNEYWYFLIFRGLVGIGEASYSTIAPTIISDLFIGDIRSKMLAFFYFAIPVGGGLGYIVGSEMNSLMGSWHWALRVTPVLGLVAVLLIYFVLEDPERGEIEGGGRIETTSFKEDIKDVLSNRTFMLTTGGFTCVAFVAGALSWWGPNFIEKGLKLQTTEEVNSERVGLVFGIVSMLAGLAGVPAGSILASRLRPRFERVDAHICAGGLLVSAPLVFFVMITAQHNTTLCYFFIFFASFFFNMTWAVVADVLLYVVVPNRRSIAEGFQLLFSHAFGDAGSPYLIGVLSDVFKNSISTEQVSKNATESLKAVDNYTEFKGMQYALFITCFVEILGGLLFLVSAFYIVEDKKKVEKALQERRESGIEQTAAGAH